MQHIDTTAITQDLRRKGYRSSKTRNAIIDIMMGSHGPFSVQDIQRILVSKNISTHLTTIYRELELLMKENHITELQFGEKKKRYERIHTNHHHHLICTSCSNIQDVALEKDLDTQERAIARTHKFKVLSHSLEFFGLCHSCNS